MTQAEYLYVLYKVIVGIVLTIGWAIMLYIPMRKAGKSSSFLLLWSTALAVIILIVKQILDLVTPLSDAVLSYFLGIFIGITAMAFLFNFKQKWLSAAPKENILFPVSLTPKKLHLRDLIQFAILMEEQGYDFYKKLGEKVKSSETRKITEWLASQELKHKKILENVLFQWLSLPMNKTLLSSLTQDVKAKGIFSNPLFSDATEEEMARYAIGQEYKMADFYLSFEKAFPEAWKKIRIQMLVMEERSHAAILLASYPQINSVET